MSHKFTSVWDAVEDTPENAAVMKARSPERMRQDAEVAQIPFPAKWNRENLAKGLAQDNQAAPLGNSVIEHVRKSHIRKEELVQRLLATQGNAPGLVQVISAL